MGWKIKPIKVGEIYGDYSFNVSGRFMGKLIVDTGEIEYGIAGDLFPMNINIRGMPGIKYLPPYCMNYIEWYYSARKLSSMCNTILPSHDSSIEEEWLE